MTAPAATTTRSVPDPLSQSVLDLVARVLDAAAAADRPDLRTRLVEEAARFLAGAAVVVMVGEPKVGKSALVNALLRRPGLVPDDPLHESRLPVVIRGGQPGARLLPAGGGEAVPIALEQLAHLVSSPAGSEGARAIEVSVPADLLNAGIVMVDTPGLGGLDAISTDLALRSLESADAIVFATAASAPLTSTELRFLERATARIDVVILALTQVDAFPGWETILEEDRRLIARHAPRFADAPFLPTSARVFAAALDAQPDEPALSAELAAESGLPVLTGILRDRVAGRANRVRLANVIRGCDQVIGALWPVSTEQDAARSSLEQLQAEHDRLRSQLESAARWETRLGDLLDFVAIDVGRSLQRSLEALTTRLEPELAAIGDVAGLRTRLEGELRTLASGLAATIDEQVRRAATETCGELAVMVAGTQLGAPDVAAAPAAQPDQPVFVKARQSYYDWTFSGSVTGMLSQGMAPLGLAMTGPIGAAGLVFGAVGAFLGHRAREQQLEQTTLRTYLRTAVREAGADLQASVQKQLRLTRRAIEDSIREGLTKVAAELQTVIDRQREAGVAAARQTTTTAQLQPLRDDSDQLRREIWATLDLDATSAGHHVEADE